MRLLSVNVGSVQPLAHAKASGVTGIFKQPQSGRVQVTDLGLAHDAICDTENHGGVDQAVYVFGEPDLEWWSAAVGRELGPGTFGENMTISDLVSAEYAIGDLLHIGEVTLQVTSPRIPCVTLARRMNDPAFLKKFRAAERPGLYCRVLKTGSVQAGDEVTLELYTGERVPAIDLFRNFYEPIQDVTVLQRHLAAPIAIRDRVDKEKQLQKLLATQTEPQASR